MQRRRFVKVPYLTQVNGKKAVDGMRPDAGLLLTLSALFYMVTFMSIMVLLLEWCVLILNGSQERKV